MGEGQKVKSDISPRKKFINDSFRRYFGHKVIRFFCSSRPWRRLFFSTTHLFSSLMVPMLCHSWKKFHGRAQFMKSFRSSPSLREEAVDDISIDHPHPKLTRQVLLCHVPTFCNVLLATFPIILNHISVSIRCDIFQDLVYVVATSHRVSVVGYANPPSIYLSDRCKKMFKQEVS